jgi:hypothetical protein
VTTLNESHPESDEPRSLPTISAQPGSLTWRSFLRLNVRSILVVVLAVGAGFGWVVHSARIQREAVAEILRAKGQDSLGFISSEITDAGLVHLERLTNLHYLDLKSTKITDAGLAHLKGLTELSMLGIRSPHVTDAGIAHLEGLTHFTYST